MCLSVYQHVFGCSQVQKRALNPLELEFQVVVATVRGGSETTVLWKSVYALIDLSLQPQVKSVFKLKDSF